MVAVMWSNSVGRISISTRLIPAPSTWNMPNTSPDVNNSYVFGSSIGTLSRVYSFPYRSLISRVASRMSVSVDSPRKSIFSRPIDSRMGYSYCVTVGVTADFGGRMSGV